MSDPHDTATHDDGPHEGPIKTPKQLIIAVVASFLVPIVAIILLVNYVDFGTKPSAGSEGLAPRPWRAPAAHRRGRDPRCRGAGRAAHRRAGLQRPVRRVPRRRCRRFAEIRRRRGLGAAHPDRLRGAAELRPQGQGRDGAAGRRRIFSDFEIGRAVVYMANQGGGKLEEPQAPAAAASAAGAAPK